MSATPARIRLGFAGVAVAVLTAASWRQDADYLYLESNGLPDHPMMTGITAWQQQVPLPHDFTGRNAFRIPRRPVFAKSPISAKEALFTGAIAVAINGVPIFNPIKNDGETDTYLAGELDTYGGHCGRADDYHYHIAPLHLETPGKPIGYSLDGFPLFGLSESNGEAVTQLDAFNGHVHPGEANDKYHYHSTRTYPYVNGGLRGEVKVEDDAITPQPRTIPVRPAGRPLRGAKVVGFSRPGPDQFALQYTVSGEQRSILYTVDNPTTFTFTFVDGQGRRTTETYERRNRPPGRKKKL